ncbi:alpha/beta fold hydrolase [Pseudonocardia sp. N23]|uniref:alpha/beta fold hydrolase n=1 Tax=Pseudonocardia sp. N23 TaxID=1987376 RepID=UPI000BFDE01C|nr:alpha/beta hydrolase [Pseudonocardia sp. N23]GAY09128.1 beta-ketoadipate enol-lactone hydrolase [Pseudonocardia sp. N23]
MRIDTGIGTVYVEVDGAGPPALLWHSLFLDARQWDRVRATLGAHRTLVLLDGPGHGRAGRPPRRFGFDDCADAAAQVLRALDLGPEVDWVGNAWGGHVGYAFAARHAIRSLVAIAAPPTPLPPAQRRRIALLTAAFRVAGARPLTGPVVDALLSPTVDADTTTLVREAFRGGDRVGMHRVMRSMMLARPDLSERLDRIGVPTLLIAGAEDPMWTSERAARAATGLVDGRVVTIPGAGHIPPLERPAETAAAILELWKA